MAVKINMKGNDMVVETEGNVGNINLAGRDLVVNGVRSKTSAPPTDLTDSVVVIVGSEQDRVTQLEDALMLAYNTISDGSSNRGLRGIKKATAGVFKQCVSCDWLYRDEPLCGCKKIKES